MKVLTLEMIEDRYNPMEWTHAFTDGSSEGAVKNGGGGVFIRHTDGRLTPRPFPTGKISSNGRAEAAALLHAAKIFTRTASQPPRKTVFFTDCKSLLGGLQSTRGEQQLQYIKRELNNLSRMSTLALQWLPSHSEITGRQAVK